MELAKTTYRISIFSLLHSPLPVRSFASVTVTVRNASGFAFPSETSPKKLRRDSMWLVRGQRHRELNMRPDRRPCNHECSKFKAWIRPFPLDSRAGIGGLPRAAKRYGMGREPAGSIG